MKHDLDEHFRKELEGLEVTPSKNLWDKIEPRLDAPASNRSWYIGIAASITIAFAVTTFISTQYQDPQIEVYPITVEPAGTESILQEIEPESSVQTEEEPVQEEVAVEVPATTHSSSKKSNRRRTADNLPVLAQNNKRASAEEFTALGASKTTAESPMKQEKTKMKVKISVSNPSKYLKSSEVQAPIVADASQDSSSVKEKIFTYAGTQLRNLINGEPVEAPEAELPKVVIPLGGILKETIKNNNNEN